MPAVLIVAALCAQSAPWIGKAFLACHDIEIARVEAIERIEGIPDACLATLRIERSIWVADCQDVRTVLVHDGWDASPRPLSVGDRSVWFLVESLYRPEEWDREARWHLGHRKFELGHRKFEQMVCRLPIEVGIDAPRVFLPNQDWDPIDHVPDDFSHSVGLREFEEVLAREIRIRTPRIESDFEFAIAPDGTVSWQWYRDRRMALHPDEMGSILAAVERERFFELPDAVGAPFDFVDAHSKHSLTVRTLAGHHRVILLGDPDKNSTRDIRFCWRFERVWQSIPQRVTNGFSER